MIYLFFIWSRQINSEKISIQKRFSNWVCIAFIQTMLSACAAHEKASEATAVQQMKSSSASSGARGLPLRSGWEYPIPRFTLWRPLSGMTVTVESHFLFAHGLSFSDLMKSTTARAFPVVILRFVSGYVPHSAPQDQAGLNGKAKCKYQRCKLVDTINQLEAGKSFPSKSFYYFGRPNQSIAKTKFN